MVEGLIALLQTLIQEVTELVDSRVDLMTLREALHIVDLLLQDTLSRLSSNCSLDLYLVIPAGFTTTFYTYPPLDHLLVVKKALCFWVYYTLRTGLEASHVRPFNVYIFHVLARARSIVRFCTLVWRRP